MQFDRCTYKMRDLCTTRITKLALPSQSTLALEELGWSSFQDLAVALCEDLFTLPVSTFSPTKDRGIDGLIEPIRGSANASAWVIQSKHSSVFAPLTESSLKLEFAKINNFPKEWNVDTYILVTNLRLSFGISEELKSKVRSLGISRVIIIGRENIVRRVRKSAALRSMVPRLYGIGDLSQILDSRRLDQAKAILQSASSDLDKFVVTESYRRSLHALRTFRLLILLGDPAVGKTTIARCLSMASVDEFDAHPIILESIEKFPDHWNPGDTKRLFWIDDTFGVTQRDDQQIQNFNKLIPIISTAMKSGSRFIFTSRSYIWNLAKPLLKLSSFAGYEDSKIEIDVRKYTEFERGQIVYNHVKMGDQDSTWRRTYKSYLPIVTRHASFKPEVARRLGLKPFTTTLRPMADSIEKFVTNPGAFLEETIAALDNPGKAALGAVLMSGGSLVSPAEGSDALASASKLFGATPAEVSKRLSAMEGAFFRLVSDEDENYWRFSHPTIGEAMASVAMEDAELLDVYLEGVPIRRLLSEVVCAGRTVKGAIIKVGNSRFEKLIDRINSSKIDNYSIVDFLSTRSTKLFREKFLGNNVDADHKNFVGVNLTVPYVISLLRQLLSDGILTEQFREIFRASARSGIVDVADIDCLSEDSRDLMGEQDFFTAIDEAWDILEDSPWQISEGWEESLDSDSDPESHFYGIQSFLEKLQEFRPRADFDDVERNLSSHLSERAAEIMKEREDNQPPDDDWDEPTSYAATQKVKAAAKANVDQLSNLFSDIDD